MSDTWQKLLKDLLGVESRVWDAPGTSWEFYGDCFLLMHWWAESSQLFSKSSFRDLYSYCGSVKLKFHVVCPKQAGSDVNTHCARVWAFYHRSISHQERLFWNNLKSWLCFLATFNDLSPKHCSISRLFPNKMLQAGSSLSSENRNTDIEWEAVVLYI